MLKSPGKKSSVNFGAGDLPVAPIDFAPFLAKLAEKKFAFGRVTFQTFEHNVEVFGDQEVCDWATGVVKSLMEASPQGASGRGRSK